MAKEIMTTNRAVAEAVKLAKPQVVPVYPITPQTTISEYLAQFVADGDLDAEYIRVESEHSFAAAGMRAPIVMADANRAISAPLNIWNDQQDSIAQRDAGWIQLYVENAQEGFDTILQAYRIAEHEEVMLPVMVCLDGFTDLF